MQLWTLLLKNIEMLPIDRPFIAYWNDHVCLIQYDYDKDRFLCSVFPSDHMQFLELRRRDLNDITHWMELPHSPTSPTTTRDSRRGNYGKYSLQKLRNMERIPREEVSALQESNGGQGSQSSQMGRREDAGEPRVIICR